MKTREPYAASRMGFYPADPARCRDQLEACLERAGAGTHDPPVPAGTGPGPGSGVVGGIVPHAGWAYSGPTAARVYRACLGDRDPDTIILFGADHHWDGPAGGLETCDAWATPLGLVELDTGLIDHLAANLPDLLVRAGEAHGPEHSMEVQVPFLQALFPRAMLCPILVPPFDGAAPLGREVARLVAGTGLRVLAFGSTDLTHYGPSYGFMPPDSRSDPLAWAKGVNDRSMLDCIERLAADEALGEARRNHNACGPGAIAAMLAYARAAGAGTAHVLEHVASCEVRPTPGRTDFVGYAAVTFR